MYTLVSLIGKPNSVHDALNAEAAELARAHGINYLWRPLQQWSPEKVVEALYDAEATAAIIDVDPYDAELISRLDSRVSLLVRFGVGYDAVDLDAATAKGIFVARTGGANARSVAEMALLLMLAVQRRLTSQLVNTSGWQPVIGEETSGVVGIVGMGAVGKSLARLLSGFGVQVLAFGNGAVPGDGVGEVVQDLDELVSRADVVSLHLPHTPSTHHLINARRLERMKPGAVLVNTSRGALVDEDALVDALRSGQLSGAGLDVFESEPLASDSQLLALPNVVLTPHSASQTRQALAAIYSMTVDIARDMKSGNLSSHVLNPEASAARSGRCH